LGALGCFGTKRLRNGRPPIYCWTSAPQSVATPLVRRRLQVGLSLVTCLQAAKQAAVDISVGRTRLNEVSLHGLVYT